MTYGLKCKLGVFLLLAGSWGARAQTTPEAIARDHDRSAGIYRSYQYQPGCDAAAPAGYVPFYISHYGRHGSRYHTSASAYRRPLATLEMLADSGALTARGEEVLSRLRALSADADRRYGDLSPRGVQEHRGIAERMMRSYPEVFSTEGGRTARVECRSTLVPRCILSMAAFGERLKELNPSLTVTRESSARYLDYLANGPSMEKSRKEAGRVADSLCRVRLRPERLMGVLTTEPGLVSDPVKLMTQLFVVLSIVQDVSHTGIAPFYDLFTDGELYDLWACENVRRYLQMGPSARFGDPIVADATPLLRNIVETAQSVIDGSTDLCASLRFGHDTYLTPLLALLGIEGASARVSDLDTLASRWSVELVTPMAGNLQLIFFRHTQNGDIRVRVLHNEHDAVLPLAGGPYYAWPEFKAYCESCYRQ